MQTIASLEELKALYGDASPGAITKVVDHLSPMYRQWIEASRFAILSTVGPQGTDASPRGDVGPVVRVVDGNTLWLPDWRGNNRLDSLSNVVEDGRVSLMFMIPGHNNVVRVNGRACLSADTELTSVFERAASTPRTVIVITVQEVYFQCAKALMRSGLWHAPGEPVSVPTAGQFLQERAHDSAFDARSYDEGYAEYARDRMW